MTATRTGGRAARLAALLLSTAIPGCAGAPSDGPDPRGEGGEGTAFVLVLDARSSGPIWVAETDASSQPAWVTLRGPMPRTDRVLLRERCDLSACGAREGVCGMAIPVVRRIGPGDSIRVDWDGRTSRMDPERSCEIREPPPPGAYTAEFCWTRTEPGAAPSPVDPPPLRDLTCRTREVTLPGPGRVAWIVE